MSRKELSQRCDHSSGFQAQYCIYFKGRFTEVQFIYSLLSPVQLFVALWTVARQAPLSMGFLSQEYWSGLPFPSPGALSDPGIKLMSPAWQVDSLPLSHLGCPFIGRGPVLGNLCTHCMVTSAGRLQHVAWCLLHSRRFLSGKKEARGSCVFSPGCESSLIP